MLSRPSNPDRPNLIPPRYEKMNPILVLILDLIEDLYKGNPSPSLVAPKIATVRALLGSETPAPVASTGAQTENNLNGTNSTGERPAMG